ncbi:sulfotransferase family protein [Haloglycomyces albus]|uniref:sulfotransferase family protein n=1 Tax=Haloglycomyces albus TaxID=526067 RepID=UPI00046C9FA8|nr:sulfotransferase [Haloglycomyces albus]
MERLTRKARIVDTFLSPIASARKDPDKALRLWEDTANEMAEQAGVEPSASDRAYLADYGYLLRQFCQQPDFRALGWLGQFEDAKSRWDNRLRVSRLLRERPEIAAEPIERPVFVVGLPRTATSLTHRILARSARHRGPLMWEMKYTDLTVDEKTERNRIQKVAKDLSMLPKFSPAFDVIHPVRAELPDETIMILPHTWAHLCVATMPEYWRWLRDRDMTDDLTYLKQSLQVLQHGRQRKRWIMKYPGHLAHLDTIMKVFPDAQIVWTHREPETVMGSMCSLAETAHGIHVKDIDRERIGELWLEILTHDVEQGRKARHNLPPRSIIDLPYHRLMADPYTMVPDLYDRINAQWTESDTALLEEELNRPKKMRRHEYQLSDYGLTTEHVSEAFGDYNRLVQSMNQGGL